jgi:hypothetical protein
MGVIFLMAADAGHWRVVELGRIDVALGANQAGMRAREGEDIEVIEGGGLPGGGGMAGLASCAFRSAVNILGLVTANAGHRGALKFAIDVTGFAFDVDMRAGQLKGGQVMIEGGRLPRG